MDALLCWTVHGAAILVCLPLPSVHLFDFLVIFLILVARINENDCSEEIKQKDALQWWLSTNKLIAITLFSAEVIPSQLVESSPLDTHTLMLTHATTHTHVYIYTYTHTQAQTSLGYCIHPHLQVFVYKKNMPVHAYYSYMLFKHVFVNTHHNIHNDSFPSETTLLIIS